MIHWYVYLNRQTNYWYLKIKLSDDSDLWVNNNMRRFSEKRSSRKIRNAVARIIYAFEHSGPEVIKLFSCSTQLSIKFILLMNLKILTFFLKLLS